MPVLFAQKHQKHEKVHRGIFPGPCVFQLSNFYLLNFSRLELSALWKWVPLVHSSQRVNGPPLANILRPDPKSNTPSPFPAGWCSDVWYYITTLFMHLNIIILETEQLLKKPCLDIIHFSCLISPCPFTLLSKWFIYILAPRTFEMLLCGKDKEVGYIVRYLGQCMPTDFIFNGLHIQRKAAIVCFSVSEKLFNVESDEQMRRSKHAFSPATWRFIRGITVSAVPASPVTTFLQPQSHQILTISSSLPVYAVFRLAWILIRFAVSSFALS